MTFEQLWRLRRERGASGLAPLRKICAKGGHVWERIEGAAHGSFCARCLFLPMATGGDSSLPPGPLSEQPVTRTRRLPLHFGLSPATQLGYLFRLKKRGVRAELQLITHRGHWAIHLRVGESNETVQMCECHSAAEVFATADRWKAALEARGWRLT